MQRIEEPMVFVFGSNEAGIHGAGAAKAALKQGAEWGVGFGRRGNTFAIPTKDRHIRTLPLKKVDAYIQEFLSEASKTPQDKYQVTQIGCGLAGFTADEMAPLFAEAPDNCYFDEQWKLWLPTKQFWGTF